MYKPDPRQAALLLLHGLEERGESRGKPMTRVRLSRLTLKELWNVEQLNERLLTDVNEWLLSAGWTLFYAGSTYGAVRNSVVKNWPRLSANRMRQKIDDVKAGKCDFAQLEYLFKLKEPDARRSRTSRRTVRRRRRET